MPAPPTSPNQARHKALGAMARGVVLLGLAALIFWLTLPGEEAPPSGAPSDDAALQRAARCEGSPLTYLVAHTADQDWRVRAAAYDELTKHAPFESVPLRDTPIDERETILLDWLNRHEPGLASDPCELFVQTDHLRFGRPLMRRCLTCHVGPEPTPALADTRCVACHEAIHTQWAGTAHANSTTHLRLTGIDPVTRQQVPYDFGERKGMSCVACHRATGEASASGSGEGAESAVCVASFEAVSCGTCHTEAQAQWQAWRDGPRYRRAIWPPGSVEQSAEEPAGCADCHMVDGEHLWAARRDTDLLRAGLALSISRDADHATVLTLRNLAGHHYPTGTTRRALRVYTKLDEGPEQLTAVLADTLPGLGDGAAVTGPALKPGEARRIVLPGRAAHISARFVYVRNRFEQDAYIVEVLAIDHVRPDAAATD